MWKAQEHTRTLSCKTLWKYYLAVQIQESMFISIPIISNDQEASLVAYNIWKIQGSFMFQ